MIVFITLGVFVIIGGFIVWRSAALGKGSIDFFDSSVYLLDCHDNYVSKFRGKVA